MPAITIRAATSSNAIEPPHLVGERLGHHGHAGDDVAAAALELELGHAVAARMSAIARAPLAVAQIGAQAHLRSAPRPAFGNR